MVTPMAKVKKILLVTITPLDANRGIEEAISSKHDQRPRPEADEVVFKFRVWMKPSIAI